MSTVLITGANRGIGLAFARAYAADGWHVHAACREPDQANDLNAIEGEVQTHGLDVADADSVVELARELEDISLDVLINNAGVGGGDGRSFGELDYAMFAHVLDVNVLGPLRMAEAFTPHLEIDRGGVLANVTSGLGSIENNTGGMIKYRTSKAALNQAMVTVAHELVDRGIVTILVHPGWVRTRMGGDHANLAPEEAVEGMRQVIANAKPADNGRFFRYDGSNLPW